MIYTLTLNPSIDYLVQMDHFIPGITNRTIDEMVDIGGKGINVSCILAQLGLDTTALGFTAGFTGEEIERQLQVKGIRTDMIRLKQGMSRINIKLRDSVESEINVRGPWIDSEDMERLMSKIMTLSDGDTLVMAGSVPGTAAEDTYEKILKALKGKKLRIVVDTANQQLLNCLSYHPFLIKPNRQELSELFHTDVNSEQITQQCARKLIEYGAENVLVSLGSDGAVLFAADGKIYRSGVLKGPVLNAVGAGDSMVAGFIAGFEGTGDYAAALRLGTACGNATAFSRGLADYAKITDVLDRLPQCQLIGEI